MNRLFGMVLVFVSMASSGFCEEPVKPAADVVAQPLEIGADFKDATCYSWGGPAQDIWSGGPFIELRQQ